MAGGGGPRVRLSEEVFRGEDICPESRRPPRGDIKAGKLGVGEGVYMWGTGPSVYPTLTGHPP